jgi:hypothetical protein
VLAARDPSGSHGLVEGRTAAGSLLICCGTFLPDGAHDVTKIHPGCARDTVAEIWPPRSAGRDPAAGPGASGHGAEICLLHALPGP